MKVEIKCYKVLEADRTIEIMKLQCTENKRLFPSTKLIEVMGELYILFSETHREKIFGMYNDKYPVSDMYVDDIPLVIVEDGKYESRTCMLNEVQDIQTIDDVNVGDYIFTVERL